METGFRLSRTIYRIEHPSSGWGICRHDLGEDLETDERFSNFNVNLYYFPTPRTDNIRIKEDQYCAFKTIEQITELLNPDELRIVVLELGFRIYKLEVEVNQKHFSEGDKQVVFKKDLVIFSEDISEYFLEPVVVEV